MIDWNCKQVEGWIDLYAAGECDAPTRAAVDRHLNACPTCRRSLEQAQQLLALLDQRFQESDRLQRLWSRVEAERKPTRRTMRPMLWRAAAIAAGVLLTLGLSGWVGPGGAPSSGGVQLAAVLNPLESRAVPGPPGVMEMNPAKIMAESTDAARDAAREYPLDLGGKTSAEFRAAVRTDRPPPPPAIDLVVEVRNASREVLPLRFSDERTELSLDLKGPGVLDVPAPPGTALPLADLGFVQLAPGANLRVPIRKLAYGSRGAVRYAYWTAPGEYTLTITLRVAVQADPLAGTRDVTATTGPLKVRVVREP